MKVLVPPHWLNAISSAARARGLSAEFVVYGKDNLGPFPGATVLFRGPAGHYLREAIDNAADLEWVHTTSAGVEGISRLTAPRKLTLTESGDVYRICIGEFVMAFILFAAKRLGEFWLRSKARQWEFAEQVELFGQTVGIIGVGPIGVGVAERARGFGMRTLGCRRTVTPAEPFDEIVGPESLDRLLAESDYVVVSCPLTEQTRGLVGAAELAKMKPTAWIINIARGQIIDSSALIDALHAGRIAGACLDVTDPEPLPPDHALWQAPNVFITPHASSGLAPQLQQRQADLFVDLLERRDSGRPLFNVVDYEAGY